MAIVVPEDLVAEVVRLARRKTQVGLLDRDAMTRPVTIVPAPASKGLEFDAVVVVEPAAIAGGDRRGLRLLYVAMTRPIQHLSVVHAQPLPSPLRRLSRAGSPTIGCMAFDVDGKVALITGGSNGIGEGVARHLAGRGAHVVIADIDVARGQAVADGTSAGGSSKPTSPTRRRARPPSRSPSRRSVVCTSPTSTPASPRGAAWATTSIRRPIAVRWPSTSTASSTGLRPPGWPSKRVAAEPSWPPRPWPAWSPRRSIRFTRRTSTPSSAWLARSARSTSPTASASTRLCPSFAYTNIIKGSEQTLLDMGFPIIDVADVVTAFQRILDAESTGQCWYVVAGRDSEPFQFRRAPGPRLD